MTYTLECKHSIESDFFDFQTVPMGEQGPRVGRTENLVLSFLLGSGGSAAKSADVKKLTQFEKNEG